MRLYDHLFLKPDPDDVEEGADWRSNLNPNSLEKLASCRLEPNLAGATSGSRCQFERLGYFCVDPDTSKGALVLNRAVTLRDPWVKIEKEQRKE